MGVCGFDNDDMCILLLWDNESDMEFGRRCRGYATKQPNRDVTGWSGMSGGNTVGGGNTCQDKRGREIAVVEHKMIRRHRGMTLKRSAHGQRDLCVGCRRASEHEGSLAAPACCTPQQQQPSPYIWTTNLEKNKIFKKTNESAAPDLRRVSPTHNERPPYRSSLCRLIFSTPAPRAVLRICYKNK